MVNKLPAVQLRFALLFVIASTFLLLGDLPAFAASNSRVVDQQIVSSNFSGNKIGTSPVRKFTVYLPAGYDDSSKHYPVIYFLPFGNQRSLFDQNNAQALFDHAISTGVINSFILVSVDMSTPLGPSWYVNSPVTGNWENFMFQEFVPYIDANYRTLPRRESRGLVGDYIGGYGALLYGMHHPEVFGSVYAMHPVGTGSGVQIMDTRPDWDLLANAKSLDDVKKDGFTPLFTSIFQAHLPNPDKPPLFIDLPAHKVGGQLVIDTAVTARLRNHFFIESMVPQYADNLKSLLGLKFDWPRSDGIEDHIYANQALTHKMNEFGIVHEAEEYNGTWGEDHWGRDGRVYTEVLPFFQRHLGFN